MKLNLKQQSYVLPIFIQDSTNSLEQSLPDTNTNDESENKRNYDGVDGRCDVAALIDQNKQLEIRANQFRDHRNCLRRRLSVVESELDFQQRSFHQLLFVDIRNCLHRSGTMTALPPCERLVFETDNFVGEFAVGKLIGSGNHSHVRECRYRTDKEDINIDRENTNWPFAMKQITKSKMTDLESLIRVDREIAILRDLSKGYKQSAGSHPNILSYETCFHTRECIYLLTERVTGGDLFEFMAEYVDGMPHVMGRPILRDVITAVDYIHSLLIVHRDIKPENILIRRVRSNSRSLRRSREASSASLTQHNFFPSKSLADNDSADNDSADNGSADNGSADNDSADNGSADNGSADNDSADNGSADNNSTDNNSTDNGSADTADSYMYQAVLCDFGLAVKNTNYFDVDKCLGVCGSPGFFPPEMMRCQTYNGIHGDLWSIGCVALELFTSHQHWREIWMPNYDEKKIDTDDWISDIDSSIDKIIPTIGRIGAGVDNDGSKALRELVHGMLRTNPRQRKTTLELLRNRWFD
jgi:serine/threonine protein kinase